MNSAAPVSDRFFTLANVMTLSRVPLAGVFWLSLHDRPTAIWTPLTVLLVAGVTDILDGKFARLALPHRTADTPTGAGAWLDPICDKIFVGIVLISLHFERELTLNLLLMIWARELIQIPTSLGYKLLPVFRGWFHYDFTATNLGKLTTVLQFSAIVSLLFATRATPALAIATCLIGLLAAGEYMWRVIQISRRSPPPNRK